MRFNNLAIVASLGLAALGLGCQSVASPQERALGLHPKLSTSAYIEEGNQLALMVDTKLARLRAKEEFIPFEVGVANKGLEGLTLRLESFRLVDEAGNSYPAVRGEELAKGYGSVDTDRRLGQLLPFMQGRFQTFNLVPSALTRSFDVPLEVNSVQLPRYNMTYELIYFPRPESGVKGEVFSVLMSADQLDDPVVIKLKVRG